MICLEFFKLKLANNTALTYYRKQNKNNALMLYQTAEWQKDNCYADMLIFKVCLKAFSRTNRLNKNCTKLPISLKFQKTALIFII